MKRKTIGIILIVTPFIGLIFIFILFAVSQFIISSLLGAVDEEHNKDRIINVIEQPVNQIENREENSLEPLKEVLPAN